MALYSKYHYLKINRKWVTFTVPESAEPNKVHRRKVRSQWPFFYFIGVDNERVGLGHNLPMAPTSRRKKKVKQSDG